MVRYPSMTWGMFLLQSCSSRVGTVRSPSDFTVQRVRRGWGPARHGTVRPLSHLLISISSLRSGSGSNSKQSWQSPRAPLMLWTSARFITSNFLLHPHRGNTGHTSNRNSKYHYHIFHPLKRDFQNSSCAGTSMTNIVEREKAFDNKSKTDVSYMYQAWKP